MKKNFIVCSIYFLLCAQRTLAQTKNNNVGDLVVSGSSIGFLFKIIDNTPSGFSTRLGYEFQLPPIPQASSHISNRHV